MCHVEGGEVRITRQSHESGPSRGKLRGKGNIKKSLNARIKFLKAKIQYLAVQDNTFLLTPWSRVLLEKLTGFQLVKKFPAFYGTRRFITDASARHLSLF